MYNNIVRELNQLINMINVLHILDQYWYKESSILIQMEFEFYEIYVTFFVMKKKARKLSARDKNHTDTQP